MLLVSDSKQIKKCFRSKHICFRFKKYKRNVLDQNVFVSDTQKIPLVIRNVRLPWTKGRRRRRAGRRRRNLRRKTPEPQNRKFNQEETTSIHEPEPKSRVKEIFLVGGGVNFFSKFFFQFCENHERFQTLLEKKSKCSSKKKKF